MTQNDFNDSKWLKMTKITENDSDLKWLKMTQMTEMTKNDSKCLKMTENDLKWLLECLFIPFSLHISNFC